VRNSAFKRHPIVAFLIALAVLATPGLLFAHAHLLRSTPAANATVTSLPTNLALWFSEKPEVEFTVITLADSAGVAVNLGKVASLPSNGITVPILGGLRSGTYTVTWRTAASDGHATSGTYKFSIAPSAAPAATAPAAVSPQAMTGDTTAALRQDTIVTHTTVSNALVSTQEGATFSSAVRWAELVALLTTIGLVIFRLAVLPVAGWSPDLVANASMRAARLGRAVLVLLAVAVLSRGFAQASLLPAFIGSRFAALLAVVENTNWGAAWAVGACGVVVVIAGFLLASRMLAGWIIAAVGLVIVAVSEALTGHSGAVPHAAAAIAADVAHVLAAGGWLGGLTAVLLCGLPALKQLDAGRGDDAGKKLIVAYHNSAMECVAVVVVSAIIAAWVRLPNVSSLWTTPYGLALIRKIIFVLIVMGFGFYHWRRIVVPTWTSNTLRHFKRSAAVELLFGAIVVALTAYLLIQPLP
jgi:copper transport protein